MKQTSSKNTAIHTRRAKVWRSIASVLLLAVVVIILIQNRAVVGRSVTALGDADVKWLIIGLLLSISTFAVAAVIYVRLALHRLRYVQTLAIELAASFANRLLPSGLGGLGLHGLYLHKQKHTPAEATAIVSVNNLIGIVAHVSLLLAVCIAKPQLLSRFSRDWPDVPWVAVGIALVFIVTVLIAIPKLRLSLMAFGRNLAVSFRKLQLSRVITAYLLALLLTCIYTLTLWASARAVDVNMSILQAFIVFSVGMLAGTATPTPGGLVGVEAGLYAGFVSYGTAMAPAGAAALLYRLLTYWLPLIPGLLALLFVRSRKFV